jgi:hypothetical protein
VLSSLQECLLENKAQKRYGDTSIRLQERTLT